MDRTGLDFAPGTTDESRRLVSRLFTPTELLGAYRMARAQFRTGDLVLQVSESDPSGFQASPRIEYLKTLRRALGAHARATLPVLGIAQKSAHSVASLPFESEAMWLVVVRGKDMPSMCVLYAVPYEYQTASNGN